MAEFSSQSHSFLSSSRPQPRPRTKVIFSYSAWFRNSTSDEKVVCLSHAKRSAANSKEDTCCALQTEVPEDLQTYYEMVECFIFQWYSNTNYLASHIFSQLIREDMATPRTYSESPFHTFAILPCSSSYISIFIYNDAHRADSICHSEPTSDIIGGCNDL